MPTVRSFTFLAAALVLYLLANQTQVGWLYVTAALLAAVVPSAWLAGRGALRGVEGERHLEGDTLYEGDVTGVQLRLRQRGRRLLGAPASQVCTAERCPLAAPGVPERRMELFVPSMPRDREVTLDYEVQIYRRGVHHFPPLLLRSRAPFGLFQWRRSLRVATDALVYPEVRSPGRLLWLDMLRVAEQLQPRVGRGSEVLGVRPYRHGDSPRHIHWRTVARRQQLMTKEFADEAHAGVTLALDVRRYPYAEAAHKHTPFEWAIKVAASIGDYARRRDYGLEVVADGTALAVPTGAVSWHGLLEYLARVEAEGSQSLAGLLLGQPLRGFLVAILPWPDGEVAPVLGNLQRAGLPVLALVIDPASFPEGGPGAGAVADELAQQGVSVRLIRYDEEEDWVQQMGALNERTMAPLAA